MKKANIVRQSFNKKHGLYCKGFLSIFILLIFSFSYAQEKIVEEIQFIGLKKLKKSFVVKQVSVRPNVKLDSVGLQEDVDYLKRLAAIANATFTVNDLGKDRVSVLFTIEENFTTIPFANLYTSSTDDFAFRVGLQEFNFLGRNTTLGAFYQFDVFSSYGVNFRAPNLFSKKLGLAISYKDLTTQEPVFFANDQADYKYNNKGVEALGLYQFNTRNRIELGASLFREEYTYLLGVTSPDVPLHLDVKKHLFKFIYEYNNIQYFYQYLDGFRSVLNLQYVGSPNKNLSKFLIGFNDFLYYKRVGEKGNWASRLRVGLATNKETPFSPFTVDNNINIRGVGNTIDRGSAAIVFNTEYRQTLIDRDWFVLQSNVFIDGGTWRNPGGDLSDFTRSNNIRIFPGVGLRFMHKRIFNAIFRIDYGYGISKKDGKGLVFGIGQYF